jgi:hypothetical protein
VGYSADAGVSITHVVAGIAGAAKLSISVLVLRAGFMALGDEAAKLRRAFLLTGSMLIADGAYFMLLALRAPKIVLAIWLGGIATWSIVLAVWLVLRRNEHREALYKGVIEDG